MTPRVPPVAEPTEEQQRLLAKSLPGPDGNPLNLFTTLVRAPELMRRVNALGGYFFVHGSIAVRERELVILRTAGHVGCTYELGQHRWIGAGAGLSAEEIAAAIDPTAPHQWSERDARLLACADEVLATDTVSDALWESLAADHDETARTELLVLVGYYRMLAGVLNGLGVELDASVAALLEA